MKKITTVLVVLGLLALGGQSFAVIGTGDAVPAATLLLPYFEVDIDDCDAGGITTAFSVNNASAAPQVVHVVVWSDWSVPVLDFDIFLTGYDVQSVNLCSVIKNGNLPITAPDGVTSNVGDFSDQIPTWPAFPTCDQFLPYTNPALNSNFRNNHLQPALTGNQTTFIGNGSCVGHPYGDNIARGYVTMDVVSDCNLADPSDSLYIEGLLNFDNVIWGDYFYIESGENFAQGETLVHVEAAEVVQGEPTVDLPAQGFVIHPNGGIYTFYGRYEDSPAPSDWEGEDYREAFASTWASRFLNGGLFDGGTDLIVWRDSKQLAETGIVTCGGRPSWFELVQEQVVIFDEEENPEVPEGATISPPPPTGELTPFPIEAQRVPVGGEGVPGYALPVSPDFGWIYLNLNYATGGNAIPVDPAMQNWVTTIMDAEGRFSVGFNAIQLDNVSINPVNVCLGFNGAIIPAPCN